MVEIKDGKKILTTPISAEDLKDIHIGDIIYLQAGDKIPADGEVVEGADGHMLAAACTSEHIAAAALLRIDGMHHQRRVAVLRQVQHNDP